MRVGFATIYSWRPHVEHLYFLAGLVRKAGHEAFYLTCDGDLPDCYSRELRGRPAWRECLECRAGGIRSYTTINVTSIGDAARSVSDEASASPEWSRSSASTLGRFESDGDYASTEFAAISARLEPAAQRAYAAARSWIARNKLEAVCVFNGRMDATRAIYEAARSLGVRVVSVERTWFGDGLQLYPDENCLGLKSVNRLVAEWRDVPLSREQALRASAHVAARFLRTNDKEWRAYNVKASAVDWPITTGRRRILLIPSSRNEVWGHPDWEPAWKDPTHAYDALMETLALDPADLLLRCHPNWGENIGKQDGSRSERHYVEWAKNRSVHYIPSTDNASTLGLIEQCDAIVVANGSAAMEAGFLGKQIIGIAPSIYQNAGIRDSAATPDEMRNLRLWADLPDAERDIRRRVAARQTIRFLYTMIYRIPQYTRQVLAQQTTHYRYADDTDPQRLVELLRTGILRADDDTGAADSREEEDVADLIRARDWCAMRPAPRGEVESATSPVSRRWSRRLIDAIGRRKVVGDR